MNPCTYTTAQADALIHEGALTCYPWAHYWRRADSTLGEFMIDMQGMQGTESESDCIAHWVIVESCKAQIQTMCDGVHAWRDHRLRVILS